MMKNRKALKIAVVTLVAVIITVGLSFGTWIALTDHPIKVSRFGDKTEYLDRRDIGEDKWISYREDSTGRVIWQETECCAYLILDQNQLPGYKPTSPKTSVIRRGTNDELIQELQKGLEKVKAEALAQSFWDRMF